MKKVLLAAVLFLAPSLAFAQVTVDTTNINNAIVNLTGTINLLVPFFLAIAVVVFIYGVIRYIIAKGPDGREGARGYIIYGVIAIAVILAIWGLARLLINAFGLNPTGLSTNQLPLVPNALNTSYSSENSTSP